MEPVASTLRPSPALDTVTPYRPRPSGERADLVLDANEGKAPRRALASALDLIAKMDLSRYPDARPLEAAIAARLDVDPAMVLVTAGADDGLERALRALLGPGRNLVLPTPTFEMIERYVALAGASVTPIPWLSGAAPIDEMARAAGADIAAVALVTPNSPTGLWATAGDIERLSRACPEKFLLVDLAYEEFAGLDSTRMVARLPGAVAFRTLSKAWGLAGLRVGYAVGEERIIDWMRTVGHPYAVSAASVAIAKACLERGEDEMRAFVRAVVDERERLAFSLERLGARVWPSRANFLLARFENCASVRRRLASLGIAVRAFAGSKALEGCLRITLPGDEPSFTRLEAALREAVEGAREERAL